MNKKVVVFDIDGVLADFEGRLVEVLSKKFGGLAAINRHLFNLEERFADHPKILEAALMYTADPNFYYGIEPLSACQFVGELMERGVGVMYVTSRPKSHETFTRRWLQKNTPNYGKSLGLFCGVEDKADFLADVPVEFLVEDNPAEITRCKNSGIQVLTWEQEWNQDFFPRLYAGNDGLMLQMDGATEAYPFWNTVEAV
jgi:5'(3')-deoxyribonucleotidase